MGDTGPRQVLFEHLARVGGALGNAKRLELIELLAQGPRGVVALSEAAGLKVTTASAQLQTLRRAGLVTRGAGGQHGPRRRRRGRTLRTSARRCLEWRLAGKPLSTAAD
jgi:DNA-binding transcriptional ArsR family regulator